MHFFCQPPIADRKSYDKGSKVKLDSKTMEYTHHFVIRTMVVGEILCGRAVFSQDDYMKKQVLFPSFDLSFELAK